MGFLAIWTPAFLEAEKELVLSFEDDFEHADSADQLLQCSQCTFLARNRAGLTNHYRKKHGICKFKMHHFVISNQCIFSGFIASCKTSLRAHLKAIDVHGNCPSEDSWVNPMTGLNKIVDNLIDELEMKGIPRDIQNRAVDIFANTLQEDLILETLKSFIINRRDS